MNHLPSMNFGGKSPHTMLGLAFDGSLLEGVVLRRRNGSLDVLQRFTATLSLDPLTNEPDLVGREILNHLETAGVRERTCAVALPLNWILAAHTAIPPLAEADIPGFLQIEAERGFPTDVATLQVATSQMTSSTGQRHATFVGVPTNHVQRLEQVLHAAKLRPASFSLGITALQPAAPGEGLLALVVGEGQVGLLVTCGGGVVALRALEGAVETEGSRRVIHGALVAREARITLGQLPADLRGMVKRIRIFGTRDQAQLLADEIRPRFEPAGLNVELVTTYPADEFSKTIPADTGVSRALSLAARQLIGRDDPFEFLPPRVSRWQQVSNRYASGRLRTAGLIGAAVVFFVLISFGYQQWQLVRLRSRWTAMAPKVRELSAVQDQIQKFRPWYDESFRYLTIMKKLTLAFPQDGSVTAKTLEIRELTDTRNVNLGPNASVITCSGTAANLSAWNSTVNRVGAIPGVTNVVPPIRGRSPIQFTLEFNMIGGVNEN